MRPSDEQLTNMIADLVDVYDQIGSELPEGEVNFLELLTSKAVSEGLNTSRLSDAEVMRILSLHKKYMQAEDGEIFGEYDEDGEGL